MELVVDVLGTAVALRAPGPVLAELRRLLVDLEPGRAPGRQLSLVESTDRLSLLDDGAVIRTGIAPSVAAATMVWRLNTIAAAAPGHVVVHAGCVAGQGGVLLPGQSGTGKSTLTAACVEVGLSYLSDEFAVLDLEHVELVPYAKPLGLEAERLLPASELRSGAQGIRCRPAGLVFPRYEPSASSPSVTRLDSRWALLALAAHCTNLASVGAPALALLAGLATACPAWQITYADAGDAVPTIEHAAAAPVAAVVPAEILSPVTPETVTVAVDDDLAVLHEPTGQVHLLNASAALVWGCVKGAADVASLIDAALQRAPTPAFDRPTVSATVRRLASAGLLPQTWPT